VVTRFWIALIGGVTVTAVACGGEPRELEETSERRQAQPAATSEECPADWPGPWTACPEADWVGQVAERAGYRLTGETGSALIARGHGTSVYIWAFEATAREIAKASRQEMWEPVGRVDGVRLYGDGRLRRWWIVDDFIVWVEAGPYAHSRLPSSEGLKTLIRASETIPLPG
jgi:hypothetical protein